MFAILFDADAEHSNLIGELQVYDAADDEAPVPRQAGGLEDGLNSLIAISDGDTVPAPRYARRAQIAQRRRQRAGEVPDRFETLV